MRTVGDLGCDFDAAIDRTRSEDQDVAFAPRESFRVHSVELAIFVYGGEGTCDETLKLNAQEVEDVAFAEKLVERVARFDAQILPVGRDKGRGAANDRLRAEFLERVDVRTSDATVSDIADDRDFQSLKGTETLTNGESVEKSLRRMLVRAVSRVDDGASLKALGEELRNAWADVSDDDGVDPHRLDVLRCVDDRFPLSDATRTGGKVDDFRA